MLLKLMNDFLLCIRSPQLYRLYHRPSLDSIGQPYSPNFAEYWGDFAISYFLPVGTIYCVWQRRLNYFGYLALIWAASYLLRAAGRAVNPTYVAFLEVLHRAERSFSTENEENLRYYDFQFTHWPVGFKSEKFSALVRNSQHRTVGGLLSSPCWMLGWLMAHTFGIRLIYPGVFFSSLLRVTLEDARANFVSRLKGTRTRVEAADGNKLDTMFIDRRGLIDHTGEILVINFEGNAGFYEIGIMVTPLDMGYSVLGWNHPGFAGSTGVPYPAAELNAAEAIFDYAINKLNFKEENIILFAWSIGGYPAAHLAAEHPKIKALILDATFDDLMPLALPRMPAIMSGLVRSTIRNHVDIRVNKELRKYSGPLRLIRRTDDEIIADPPGFLTNNRGNYLLVDVIRTRFPGLLGNDPFNPNSAERALNEWLSKPHIYDSESSILKPRLAIPNTVEKLSDTEKSRLVIAIADNLMTDFKSTHCTPLLTDLFQMPWVESKKDQ